MAESPRDPRKKALSRWERYLLMNAKMFLGPNYLRAAFIERQMMVSKAGERTSQRRRGRRSGTLGGAYRRSTCLQVQQSSIKRARRLPCRPCQLRDPADGFINVARSPLRVPSGLFGARGTVVHELNWNGKSRAGRAWQRTLLRSEAVMSQVRLKRA